MVLKFCEILGIYLIYIVKYTIIWVLGEFCCTINAYLLLGIFYIKEWRMDKMNIGVIGCGYVGLSNAVLLAHQGVVSIWDIDESKLSLIREGKSPFKDDNLDDALKNVCNNLNIASSLEEVVNCSEVIFLALPTDYDTVKKELDTSNLEKALYSISSVTVNENHKVVIRSTVPIGFSEKMNSEQEKLSICYMPEFLREGNAFIDTVNPERLVFGGDDDVISSILPIVFNAITKAGGEIPKYQVLPTKEAEAIKLFSNTYLAMRIAFINELDSFAECNGLSSSEIIKGVCADSRIGNIYNNPSFGYGGYCLPKDTKQLAKQIDSDGVLIGMIDYSNENRKKIIVNKLLQEDGPIGIYRLQSKKGADNIRNSVMFDIMNELVKLEKEIYLYEPLLLDIELCSRINRVNTVSELNDRANIIVANWMDDELIPYKEKVYTRDKDANVIE